MSVAERVSYPVRSLLGGLAVLAASAVACGGGGNDAGLSSTKPASPATRGEAIAESEGCVSCHSADGTELVGPTWKGLWGSTVTLTDGRQVLADQSYVERSVRNPQADVVRGYAAVMPTLGLTQAELDDLVAYIESLG
jgi:cytochrome c oxidase subunit II